MSAIAGAQVQRLAARRARRPRARDALGLGLAPGDRPRAVRRLRSPSRPRRSRRRRRSPRRPRRRSTPRRAAPTGPTFLDYPLDVVFMEAEAEIPGRARALAPGPSPTAPRRRRAILAAAERPVIMAGTNLYWARGEDELRALAEALGIPVFLNGMGRGCLPADHELALQPRPRRGAQGRRRGARRRRPARLPARLRRQLRGGDPAAAARLGPERARGDPPARAGDGRRHRGHPGRDPRVRRGRVERRARPHRGLGRRAARDRDREARRRSRTTSPTTAPRCTRCASTPSWRRCSTATRS